MSSAASRPPFSTGQSLASAAQSTDSTDARPPKRPQLMGPPARPKPPKPAPEPEPAVSQKVAQRPPEPEEPQLIGPISRPSERMQYRAIGLLKGKYIAEEEQFNRGDILLSDGTLIDSVLLGRVTSLIKKHIDLDAEHLWVVYPRTLYKEEDNEPALHMQIVGVWEPETLSASKNSADKADSDEKAEAQSPRYLSTVEATEQCDQFSIRGEIAKYSEETNEITVNIVQKSKSENVKPKRPFKLLISGTLEGRTTGYFWDFKVKREGGQLILETATQIAVVPPKKKSKDARQSGRKRPAGKPRTGSSAPKPMPKKKQPDAEGKKDIPAAAKSAEVKPKPAEAKLTATATHTEAADTAASKAIDSAQIDETAAASVEGAAETQAQTKASAESPVVEPQASKTQAAKTGVSDAIAPENGADESV